MRDKRPVDELSVEELERILIMKKRETRIQRFRGNDERRVTVPLQQHEAAARLPAPAEPVTYDITTEAPHFDDEILDDGGVPQFEDDLAIEPISHRSYARYPEAQQRSFGRRVFSAFLLLVEASAVIGLVALLFLAYTGVLTVNRNIEKTDSINATSEAELAMRQIQPSATPLLSVSQVVLPGGHIWDQTGQHRFNISEVPAPYRSAFRQQIDAPRAEIPVTEPGGPIRVQIPAINVDAGIRSGDDWISLQAGVGHHPYSGNPGIAGNMVLTAHNDIFGEIFRRIDELNPGDEVRVQSNSGQWYTYVVREKMAVEPSEVWVLDQNLGQEKPLTTLITCYPYRVDTQRMVVFAELADSGS